MLLNYSNLIIGELACKDARRPVLETIHIHKGGTEVTDGFKVIAVSLPAQDAEADFPEVGNNQQRAGLFEALVPAAALSKWSVTLRGKKTLDLLNCCVAGVDGDTVEFIKTDLDTTQPLKVRQVSGDYPDTRKVFDPQPAGSSCTLNVKLLRGLLTTIEKTGVAQVKVTVPADGLSAVRLVGRNGGGQMVRSLIMPLKVKN